MHVATFNSLSSVSSLIYLLLERPSFPQLRLLVDRLAGIVRVSSPSPLCEALFLSLYLSLALTFFLAASLLSLVDSISSPSPAVGVRSGASPATAIATGAAVLVREYFEKGFYPTGDPVRFVIAAEATFFFFCCALMLPRMSRMDSRLKRPLSKPCLFTRANLCTTYQA